MNHEAQYRRLIARSDRHHKRAGQLASERRNYDAYKWHVEESWRLADEAMVHLNALPAERQAELRSEACGKWMLGFANVLVEVTK